MNTPQRSLWALALVAAAALAACGGGGSDTPAAAGVTTTTTVATPTGLAAGTTTQRLRYRMDAVSGGQTDATALLFTPAGTPPAGGWPLVVWAHATTGVADGCAPSRNFAEGGDVPVVAQLMAQGMAVLAPDYEGLGTSGVHPYYNRSSHGKSVISAVQAALALPGSPLASRWAIIGHEQGGHVALAAAEMAGALGGTAPLRAVVALAPESDWAASTEHGFQRIAALKAAGDIDGAALRLLKLNYTATMVALGAQAQQPSLDVKAVFGVNVQPLLADALVDANCKQYVPQLLTSMATWANAGGDLATYPGVSPQWTQQAGMPAWLAANRVGTVKLAAPVMVVQGALDDDVPVGSTRSLVAGMRQLGTEENLVELPTGDHDAVVTPTALAPAIEFLRGKLVAP